MANQPDRPDRPTLLMRVGDGERIPAAGVEHLFKLTGATTGGHFGLEEFTVPPGVVGARPHVHSAHDEYFYVLAGHLTVTTADGDLVLSTGDIAAAVRGTLHGFSNTTTDPVRAPCMYTPPGYEQYFRDVHAAVEAGHDLTPDLLADRRSRYHTTSY